MNLGRHCKMYRGTDASVVENRVLAWETVYGLAVLIKHLRRNVRSFRKLTFNLVQDLSKTMRHAMSLAKRLRDSKRRIRLLEEDVRKMSGLWAAHQHPGPLPEVEITVSTPADGEVVYVVPENGGK